MEKGITLRAFIGALSILVVMLGSGTAVLTAEAAPAAGAATTSTSVKQAKAALGTGWKPTWGGTFNHGRSSKTDMWRIEAQLLKGINKARKGSWVRVSLFSFDRMPVADALIRAKRRGVHVQVILNDHQNNSAMRKMKNALGTKRTKKSWYHICRNSCRGTYENLHTKMVLYSHTGGAKNVTMTGSFNFTANAAINQHNDLFTTENNKVYKAFLSLFWELMRDKPVKLKHRHYKQNITNRFQLEVMPRPNWNQTRDPQMRELRRVKCTGANNGTGANGRTVIRVGMHTISGRRGTWLAKKVRALFAAGCNVRVWYSWADRPARNVFATRTKRGYIPVHVAGYDTNEDGQIDLYGHHKVLLISGNMRKDRSTSMVYTGSSNWGNAGLRGDEIIFRISGQKYFKDWNRNFDSIWYRHSYVAKYIPYPAAMKLRTATAWEAVAPEPELRRPSDWEN